MNNSFLLLLQSSFVVTNFTFPTHTYYNLHPPNPSHITAKRVFLDVIIEDDEGEVEEVIVPYQLSKEAVVLEMKVQDIKVWGRW